MEIGLIPDQVVSRQKEIAREVVKETWLSGHVDFWHKNESNFGQSFVAIPHINSAAYDSQYAEHICWLPKSAFAGNSEPHKEYVALAEARANLISAAPEMARVLSGLLDHLQEHDADAYQAARQALTKAGVL